MKKIFEKMINIIMNLFISRNVYYINGPQVLPPPLSQSQEDNLYSMMEKDPEYVKGELISHNLRLVVYIARKYDNVTNIEDLISIGTIGLIKAVNTFCPDKKIKLATYASRCIENEILMYIRKTSSQKGEISLDEPLNVDWDGNELLLSDVLGTDADNISASAEAEDERNMLIELIENLPDREKQIMSMRFGIRGYNELTQKQVADSLGISQSYISRLEKRIIQKLKKEIENSYCV